MIQAAPNGSELRLQGLVALGQGEELVSIALDRLNVGDEGVGVSAYALEALVVGAPELQGRQLLFEGPLAGIDAGCDQIKLLGGRRGRQVRRRSHQGAAVFRDTERGLHLGDADVIHTGLGFAHAGEGEQTYQTRGHGQDHAASKSQIEPGGDAETACQQALQPVGHGSALRRVSTGWYLPSPPITVTKTASEPWLSPSP